MIGNIPSIGGVSSFSSDALLTTTYADDYVVRGMGFQVKTRIVLTSLQTRYVVIDTSALIGTGKILFTLPLVLASSNGLVFFDTYGIDSYTGGSDVDILKLNSIASIDPLSVAKIDITPTGGPYNKREYVIGGQSTPLYSGAGVATDETIKIFPAGAVLVGKIENKESDNNVFNFGFTFYEICVTG